MILLVPLLAAALNAGPQPSASAILHRMAAANSWVKTYKVRIHFDAKVHSFISLPLALNATLYYKQPDKMQIVFDSVPSLAKQFQNFYASTGTPQTWPHRYVVTLVHPNIGDPNNVILRLAPRTPSNLDYALMTVDTTTYGVVTQQWFYKDGSNISVSQDNDTGPRYVLPSRQEGDFDFPRYRAHVVADYDAYDFNVPIPDSIFKQQQQ